MGPLAGIGDSFWAVRVVAYMACVDVGAPRRNAGNITRPQIPASASLVNFIPSGNRPPAVNLKIGYMKAEVMPTDLRGRRYRRQLTEATDKIWGTDRHRRAMIASLKLMSIWSRCAAGNINGAQVVHRNLRRDLSKILPYRA